MRETHPGARIRTTVLALAIATGLGLIRGAEASPILPYQTLGAIGTEGATLPGAISFENVSQEKIHTPAYASLGDFRITHLQQGYTATYKDTPFSIRFLPQASQVEGQTGTPKPLVLTGHLDGSVTGGGSALVTATFNPPAGGVVGDTFKFAGGTLALPKDPLWLQSPAEQDAKTTILARVSQDADPKPSAETITPEPTSAAAVLAGLAGLGLFRRLRRKG